MKKYIYKAAASCALVLAFAACQKEGTVATSSSNNSVESSTTEKTEVVFNVGTSELSRTTDLAPLFDISIEDVETNGFYLYIKPDSSEAVFVKMLYRTLDGDSVSPDWQQPLGWYPYAVYNGVVIDQKEYRKACYSEDIENSQLTAIYSGSKSITQAEVEAGLTINLPTQYSSLEEMASYNILYASSINSTIYSFDRDNSAYTHYVYINLQSPLALVTAEPDELYQSESSYFESITISGVATSCTLQVTDESSSAIETDTATDTTITMFKTSSAALAQVDSTAVSNDETALFVAFLPPQVVSDSKFTIKTSTSEDSAVVTIANSYEENSNNYFNLKVY